MKCQVTLDKKGKIVSVGYPDPKETPTRRSGPVAEENQTLVELDVPRKYIRMPIADLMRQLKIDIRARSVKKRTRSAKTTK